MNAKLEGGRETKRKKKSGVTFFVDAFFGYPPPSMSKRQMAYLNQNAP